MEKKTEVNTELEIKNLLTILIIVSLIVGLAYIFTISFVVNNKIEYNQQKNEKEIYAAETFQKEGSLYYVLFLDMSDYANKKIYQDIFAKTTKTLYIVDISRKVNEQYIAKDGIINTNSIETLKIKDKTLLKVINKKANSYKEGINDITSELK